MSNHINEEMDPQLLQRKKVSLQEAIKQKLASKKQNQASANKIMNQDSNTQKMRSQQTKKANNQRRRTGV